MHLMSAASCSVEGIGVWGGRNFESGGGALALDVFWEAYYTLVFHSAVGLSLMARNGHSAFTKNY